MDVGFIGTGSMGGMLIRTLVRAGALRPHQVWAANRTPAKLERLAAEVPGIRTAPAAAVAAICPAIFLCVKPGETAGALDEIGPALHEGKLLIALSNMLSLSALEERVRCRVAKLIPSLAQEVGAGISLLMYGSRVQPEDRTLLEALMSSISQPVEVAEHQGRTCSDLTSCGPAFLAYVLRELARAAQKVQPDLPPELVERLVQETALATARLLTEGGMTFSGVIERIAVPGGITAEGLQILAAEVPHAWEAVLRTTREKEEIKKDHVKI